MRSDSAVSGSWVGIAHFTATLASRTMSLNDHDPRGLAPRWWGKHRNPGDVDRGAPSFGYRIPAAAAALRPWGYYAPTEKSPRRQLTYDSRGHVCGVPYRDYRVHSPRKVSALGLPRDTIACPYGKGYRMWP